ELWEQVYLNLTTERLGLLGKLLARGDAHDARLSALYALLARAREIDIAHLMSALAVWDYCAASAQAIFGDRTGNDVADRIRTEMLPGQKMPLTETRRELFANHVPAGRLKEGLALARELGDVNFITQKSGGRDAQVVVRLPASSADSDGTGAA